MTDAQPETETPTPEDLGIDTSPLDRSHESIDEARDALSDVAASDDVTTDDDEKAGMFSEDPVEADKSSDEITSTDGPDVSPEADPDANEHPAS